MGEQHCTVCTIVIRGWWWGGAGFDGPQVTSCLRVCQHLWLESSVVPGLKPEVRPKLPFPNWLSLSYWGQGGIPSFLSRGPECKARSGCLPGAPQDEAGLTRKFETSHVGGATGRTPRFPGPLLRRTRGPDPSSKATLWVKAQHEGALPPPCIVCKDPRVPHTARRGA